MDAKAEQPPAEAGGNVTEPRAPWWSWLPVAGVAVMLVPVAFPVEALRGPLFPCLALGLAPAAAWRLATGKFSPAALRWGVGLALIAYLWRKDAISLREVRSLADHWEWLLLGLVMAPLQPWLGACRWRVLLRAAGVRISSGAAFRLTLVGTFFNLFVPGATGGDVARVGVLGQAHGKWGAAVASVVLDRVLGVPPLLLLMAAAWCWDYSFIAATPGLAWLGPVLWTGLAATMGGLLMLLVGGRWLGARYGSWVERPGWRGAFGRLAALAGAYGGEWRALAAGFFYGFVAHVATVVSCWCFGIAAGMEAVPGARYFLAVPTGLFVNAIPIAPGGVGQGEAAMGHLFELSAPGMGNAAAGVAVMLCLRLSWCLVGLAGGAVYMAGRHRLETPATPTEPAA